MMMIIFMIYRMISVAFATSISFLWNMVSNVDYHLIRISLPLNHSGLAKIFFRGLLNFAVPLDCRVAGREL
jgi:hypothetical protein